jgi:hypothetical protein
MTLEHIDERLDALEDKMGKGFDEMARMIQRSFLAVRPNPYSDLLNDDENTP